MEFAASRPFRGDVEKAFATAASSLMGLGFRIASKTANVLEFEGPGMYSTRQNSLLGASRIRIQCDHGRAELEAQLGAAARMKRFVRTFPTLLILFIGAVLCGVFWTVFGPGVWIYPVAIALGVNAGVWWLIGPWMARSIELRTREALETLLNNLVIAGESLG